MQQPPHHVDVDAVLHVAKRTDVGRPVVLRGVFQWYVLMIRVGCILSLCNLLIKTSTDMDQVREHRAHKRIFFLFSIFSIVDRHGRILLLREPRHCANGVVRVGVHHYLVACRVCDGTHVFNGHTHGKPQEKEI